MTGAREAGTGREGERPRVRRARLEDERVAVELLHASAAPLYDRFAGGRRQALRVLGAAYRTAGTEVSAEVVWLAEVDGVVTGAMAAFPVREGEVRTRRFLRAALLHLSPVRWPKALRVFRTGARIAVAPPVGALYVDALAVAPYARRRGAARALLAEAETEARRRGLAVVALDTGTGNTPAQRLYRTVGFESHGRLGPLPSVRFVKELGRPRTAG